MKKFTYEDFEKGLMLAGYIKPMNSQEALEKHLVDCLEKQKKNHPYIQKGDYVVSPYGDSPVLIIEQDGLLYLEGLKPLYEASRPLVKVNMIGWVKESNFYRAIMEASPDSFDIIQNSYFKHQSKS